MFFRRRRFRKILPLPAATAAMVVVVIASAAGGNAAEENAESISLPPLSKNIFLPSGEVRVGKLEPPGRPGRRGDFKVLGTIVSDGKRGALVEFVATGGSAWVGPGDEISGMVVKDVTAEAVMLERRGEAVLLAVGGTSSELADGRGVLAGSFALLGVCSSPDQQFAIVRLGNSSTVRRINVHDRLASGVVLEIGQDGIVLDTVGKRLMIRVGAEYTSGSAVQ